VIKETITAHWPNCENILLVLTISTGYLEKEKAIMRECAFNAGLIKEKFSESLQFTTECK
jgi:hypothetical protein